MSWRNDLDDRVPAWRALAWAAAGAVAVTFLLVVGVGLVWLLGRSPSSSNAPALGAPVPSTPTPRALSFLQETPIPSPTPPAAMPTATSIILVEEEAQESTGSAAATATPELLVMSSEDASAPAGVAAIFAASGEAELSSLATGSWSGSDDALRNEGSNAVAEPWLVLARAPNTAFAVEAEIRVNGLLDLVCDQSFGLVGGNPETGQVYGGGVLFPCGSDDARARLTDVAVWQNGYNADPVIAENTFAPGDGWRTYRFEVRGGRLRLIVDGVGIVAGSLTAAGDAAPDAEAGLWAQGVALEVRSVAVYPLPVG